MLKAIQFKNGNMLLYVDLVFKGKIYNIVKNLFKEDGKTPNVNSDAIFNCHIFDMTFFKSFCRNTKLATLSANVFKMNI